MAGGSAVGSARSRAEYLSKIGVVVEEAGETVFRLELLVDTGIIPKGVMEGLLVEANEVLAILAASHRTARLRRTAR